MKKVLLFLVMAIIATSCGLRKDVIISSYQQPTHEEVIVIGLNDNLPDNLEKIGTVSVGEKGATTTKNCTYLACITAIKDEAQKMGGHYVKIVDLLQPSLAHGTCYDITADVYIKK